MKERNIRDRFHPHFPRRIRAVIEKRKLEWVCVDREGELWSIPEVGKRSCDDYGLAMRQFPVARRCGLSREDE